MPTSYMCYIAWWCSYGSDAQLWHRSKVFKSILFMEEMCWLLWFILSWQTFLLAFMKKQTHGFCYMQQIRSRKATENSMYAGSYWWCDCNCNI